MKKLAIAIALTSVFSLTACNQQPAGAIVVPQQEVKKQEVKLVKSDLNVTYNQLIDKVTMPMKQKNHEDGGQAMFGNVSEKDGSFLGLYIEFNGENATLTRMTLMPSEAGNSRTDERNIINVMQVMSNVAPYWKESNSWLKSAMQYAYKNPNQEVKKNSNSNDFTVIYAPDLLSFEITIIPQ